MKRRDFLKRTVAGATVLPYLKSNAIISETSVHLEFLDLFTPLRPQDTATHNWEAVKSLVRSCRDNNRLVHNSVSQGAPTPRLISLMQQKMRRDYYSQDIVLKDGSIINLRDRRRISDIYLADPAGFFAGSEQFYSIKLHILNEKFGEAISSYYKSIGGRFPDTKTPHKNLVIGVNRTSNTFMRNEFTVLDSKAILLGSY